MTERGILFSAPMVRAIVADEKSQTRRAIVGRGAHKGSTFADVRQWSRIEADGTWIGWCEGFSTQEKADEATRRIYKGGGVTCPYGVVGDRLWVRETWRPAAAAANVPLPVLYRADDDDDTTSSWKPSIFMPRGASRITLDITDVRVQRLQDITAEDAMAEGVYFDGHWFRGGTHPIKGSDQCWPDAVRAYQAIWETINGKGSWALNPWVWALTFRRTDAAS